MDDRSRNDSPENSATRRRPPHALIGTAVLVALVACGDPYLHTNPYDANHPVQFAFTGPDTLFSFGEVGQYSLQTTPPWPDTGFVWATDTFTNYLIEITPALESVCQNQIVSGSTVLALDSAGRYESIAPPLEPDVFNVSISVSLGTIDTTVIDNICGTGSQYAHHIKVPRHTGYKNVVVTQRLTQIQLRCPDTHACAPLAVGDTASVWVDGTDALASRIAEFPGNVNPATGHPVATFLSRDPTIASATPVGIRVANVTALKSGTTWVVATRGALLDSLQIVVH